VGYERHLMSLPRVAGTAALALLVAVLAHIGDFGFAHALGGDRGDGILRALWAALALLAVSAVLYGALARRSGNRASAAATPGELFPRPNVLASLATLLLGGFAGFCDIESLEGHAPDLGPSLVLALVAATAAVALGSRILGRWLAELGGGLAALVAPVRSDRLAAVLRLRPPCPARAPRSIVRGARRGRAPPLARR
jgi:hypothetical protein